MASELVENLYKQGIERLAIFISQFHRWKRLSQEGLSPYRKFTAGWEIPGLLDDPALHLRLLVESSFPFTPLRIAVYPAPDVLTWPHLEEKGVLCLREEGMPTTTAHLDTLALDLLVQARSLVNACLRGEGFEDFEDEFLSYWQRGQKRTANFASLCKPEGPSRWVYSFAHDGCTYVADTEDALKKWFKNHFAKRIREVDKIPFVVLPRPLRPAEYPKVVKDLLEIVAQNEDANRLVQEYLIQLETTGRKAILLGFPGRHGFGFAGLLLPPNDNTSVGRRRAPRAPMEKLRNGFSRKIPAVILLLRHLRVPLRGALVQRCDGPWVHGRGHNPDLPLLMQKTVVCIGTGSLGSGVAELLAKMGVGKIVLVDPDLIQPENASRHTLGVRPVPVDKAKELAISLRNRFPHLDFDFHTRKWEYLYQRTPGAILSADLIISTVGIWAVEGPLNALALDTEGFPPVIFGWLEEHAAAGHAVVGSCLNCLVNDEGLTKVPVTRWPDDGTLLRVAMCGGMFQPYGAVELSHVHALVADLAADTLLGSIKRAAHRVWIGKKKLLTSGGGQWNQEWVDKYGNPGDGGKIMDIQLHPDDSCPACRELQ